MLVLTRRPNEVINIGDNIEVKILSVRDGNRVLVGIAAPESVQVHRSEVYQRIKRQEKESGKIAVPA